MNKLNRYNYLDILKVIACFLVIFIHSRNTAFFLFSSYPIGSLKFFSYMLPTIFSIIPVPIFFMVSGALLLNKEEDIKVVYKKRGLKFIAIMLFWLILRCYTLYKNYDVNFWEASKGIYTDLWWNSPYWFLYLYLGFLIILPLLRAIVKNLDNKYFYLIFCFGVVIKTVLPLLKCFTGVTINSNLTYTLSCFGNVNIFFYPLMGYFLHERLVVKNKKRTLLIMWILNITTIILTSLIVYYDCNSKNLCTETDSQQYFNCFRYINCITLFLTAKFLFNKKKLNTKIEKNINSMASSTLGIYLLHITFDFLTFINNNIAFSASLVEKIPFTIGIFKCAIIFSVCYIIVFIVKKVPILKRFV